MSLDSIDPHLQRLAKQRREACVNEAIKHGLKGGALGLSVAGGSVWLLNKYNDMFRIKFNTSAKAAFVAMPMFYLYYLEAELQLVKCSQRHKTANERTT